MFELTANETKTAALNVFMREYNGFININNVNNFIYFLLLCGKCNVFSNVRGEIHLNKHDVSILDKCCNFPRVNFIIRFITYSDFINLTKEVDQCNKYNNIKQVVCTDTENEKMLESCIKYPHVKFIVNQDVTYINEKSVFQTYSKCENAQLIFYLYNFRTNYLDRCAEFPFIKFIICTNSYKDVKFISDNVMYDVKEKYMCKDKNITKLIYKLTVENSDDTDVSALGSIQYLCLKECNKLTDVSPLRNVYNLVLFGCDSLIDVSVLGNHRFLFLIYCERVTDMHALVSVHELHICSCPISDISMLGNVHKICINDCYHVTDISALYNVNIVVIIKCDNITDVSMLGSVSKLYISDCENIKDVSMLQHNLRLNCRFSNDWDPVHNT
jgi:hypothetical protein